MRSVYSEWITRVPLPNGLIPKRYSMDFAGGVEPSHMQKEYVIGDTAPAVEIARQLAHRQFLFSHATRRTDAGRSRATWNSLAIAAIAVVSLALALTVAGATAIGVCLGIGFFASAAGTLLNARSLRKSAEDCA